jgi:hypothetical protein
MTISEDGDPPDPRSPTARGVQPVHNCWDFVAELFERIDSGRWSWRKDLHVAFLSIVVLILFVCVAWATHRFFDLSGWAVGLGAGAGGTNLAVRTYRRRRRRRRR